MTVDTLSPTFWSLIDRARALTEPKSASADADALQAILAMLSDEEIEAFAKEFNRGLIILNTWELWGAGYVIAGGMGDDSFHYFRSWIIGKGEEAFRVAQESPDDLGQFVSDEDECDNELLEYVAIELLEERGKPDPRDDESDAFPDDEPRGKAWDEDEVDSLYPKLAKKFG